MKFDFSGYATKNGIKCTDGRTILKDAFKAQDGQVVPMVWQHIHNDPSNVLGHALLENREDGVYIYGLFNDTEMGKHAKELVKHGDITALSIYANQLIEKSSNVVHGILREVSLVLAGANPGALIDNLVIQHSDNSETVDSTEAVIYTGESLSLAEIEHADGDESSKTMLDIFETMNEEQKNLFYAMAANMSMEHSDDDGSEGEQNINHSDEGGNFMKKNVFDNQEKDTQQGATLSHAQFDVILGDAQKSGSFKSAVLAHAVEYGIENIDVLFPDAQALSRDPEWLKREDGWVSGVLSAIHKSPFSRVKSVFADMDFAAARAKGYVKGTEKKETYFKASKRVTTPTTVYVKQKLDRDDILDIVDFDAVAMVRFQLRTLLDEELAMAALIGDGRDVADPLKINEENIRPIWNDDDLYSVKETLSTKTNYATIIEEIAMSGENYKGSGSPVLYTTNYHHMKMLWVKDNTGRRIYESDATLCAALGVSAIKEIPAFVGKVRVTDDATPKNMELIGIKVNLKDYNFGADKGGQIATFDDFDIDFNQYKYLMETRCSGALTKAKSAQVFEFEQVAG